MSLNKSVPQQLNEQKLGIPAVISQPVGASTTGSLSPDYASIVIFLVEPFLESPLALKVDCEMSQGNTRAWIRLAFEGTDKGRVFGRGGRNIQAIRTVLEAAASAAGQSVYLDVYGSSGRTLEGTPESSDAPKKAPPRRSSVPRPSSKFRSE